MATKTQLARFSASHSSGDLPVSTGRGWTKLTAGLAAHLDKRFGKEPSPYANRHRKRQSA